MGTPPSNQPIGQQGHQTPYNPPTINSSLLSAYYGYGASDDTKDLKQTPPSYYQVDTNINPLQPPPPSQQQQTGPYPQPQGPVIDYRNTPIPHYRYIPGVVDVIPPTYLTSPISRDILENSIPQLYTRELFESDQKKTGLGCWDMFTALTGPSSVVLLIITLIITLDNGPGLQFIALFFGIVFLFCYLQTWICCTYLCGTGVCSNVQCCVGKDATSCDQLCLSTPYFSSIFRAEKSSLQTIQESINHLSNDIPQIEFHVECSHTIGSGSDERKDVTYDETHAFPILHSKFIGTTSNQFLSSLDSFINDGGDVAINFIPKLIFHPNQIDYIAKLKKLVYESNKHRDWDTTVSAVIRCYNPLSDSNNKIIPFLAEKIIFESNDDNDDVEMAYDQDSDRESKFQKKNKKTSSLTLQSSINLLLSTSLGNRTEIYRSNGKSSNSCLQILTRPFFWACGVLTCLASCLICIWHTRFTSARYHSTFQVLLPSYDDMAHAYVNNIDLFISKPPQVQPTLMPMGQSLNDPSLLSSQQQSKGLYATHM